VENCQGGKVVVKGRPTPGGCRASNNRGPRVAWGNAFWGKWVSAKNKKAPSKTTTWQPGRGTGKAFGGGALKGTKPHYPLILSPKEYVVEKGAFTRAGLDMEGDKGTG